MQIAPGIYSLGQKEGGRVHAFLLDDGTDLTVIDSLWDTDGKRILDQIQSIGRSVTDLKHIIITHAHRSHLGGLAALQHLSGAAVYAHEWEADIISGDRKAQAVTFIPRRPFRVYPLQFGLALGVGKHPPCPVDHYVSEGDRVGPLHIMHASGHSPGHLSFYWPERRALFAGDAIATWPYFSAGWPAFNLNIKQHKATVGRMADFDAEIVAVGHGEPIINGGAARVRSLLNSTDW
jgi:glyoxylase-like metal-dependent hydrolase (beta-lactamase superfamily II)